MKLGYTIIYVADVLATVAFYERAFGLKRRFVHESNLYAELDTGETVLAFAGEPMAEMNGIAIRPNRKSDIAPGFEIALVTDDPRAAFGNAVDAGANAVSPPVEKPWGGVPPVLWTRADYERRVSECRERDPLTRPSFATRS